MFKLFGSKKEFIEYMKRGYDETMFHKEGTKEELISYINANREDVFILNGSEIMKKAKELKLF